MISRPGNGVVHESVGFAEEGELGPVEVGGVDLFRGAALGEGGEELHDVVSLDGWRWMDEWMD